MTIAEIKVGPQVLQDGSQATARASKDGAIVTLDAHARFYEQAYRGNLYSTGMSITALTANTITLTATTTPILGVWNPVGSGKNLIMLQAGLVCVPNNLTSGAGPGLFVWATSTGNGAISTGLAPLNRATLVASGSVAKGFAGSTALTGLTNNLVILDTGDFPSPSGLTYTTLASTAPLSSYQGEQLWDGSLIIPPGGVLALLNTTSSTTWSAGGRLLWEEQAI